ncbi:methylmalonyl Co-A mutase-associated GTPase MeaB, partial [Luminiphilus sp.]|nr:methylmalonyl Co-A mutase-associated GTPase MeaB [Luminiphilus sp.]
CSALKKEGLTECWAMMRRYKEEAADHGAFDQKRAEQNVQWMWQLTDEMLRQLSQMLVQVSAGELTPVTAANRIIAQLRQS